MKNTISTLVVSIFAVIIVVLISFLLPKPMGEFDILGLVITAMLGLLTVTIAWYGAIIRSQMRDDTWFKVIQETHEKFWNDEDLKEVRSWLVSEDEYNNKIKNTLKARREKAESPDSNNNKKGRQIDYDRLDKLDKLFTLIVRTKNMLKQVNNQHLNNTWHRLFIQYWMDKVCDGYREDLYWYALYFYKELRKDFEKVTVIVNLSLNTEPEYLKLVEKLPEKEYKTIKTVPKSKRDLSYFKDCVHYYYAEDRYFAKKVKDIIKSDLDCKYDSDDIYKNKENEFAFLEIKKQKSKDRRSMDVFIST